MAIEIKGVWKHGKAIPLTDVDIEEDTKVIINIPSHIPKSKSSLRSLAGVWKNDNNTYTRFKKVYTEREKFKLRL